MIFSRTQRPPFTSILAILFVVLQVSACSTDDRINTVSENIKIDSNSTDVSNTNTPTVFSGTDSGSVIEDNDPDKNNLLEVSGKLYVIDGTSNNTGFIDSTITGSYGNLVIDSTGNWYYAAKNTQAAIQNLAAGETLTDSLSVSTTNGAAHSIIITIIGVDELTPPPAIINQPALISGTDRGSVIEDIDPDYDNLLEVSGKLNISDADAGEAAFIVNTINGSYGNLLITAAGNWYYAADNNQSVIQSLSTGETLTDILVVSSIDGTTHSIQITIYGINEVVVNSPAVISGVSTGSVTEDVDPNNNGLLEVGAKLDISDVDAGEAAFIASTINGNYGSLVIDAAGNWNYAADNTQTVIQNLVSGATLTDNITVSSIDGTTQTISITIFGVDEITIASNITLSWIAPVAREDNSALSLAAIAGYRIYYGTTPGQYPNSTTINDGSATGYTFNNISSATYYFVITTIDVDGRESQYSPEVAISI